MNNDFTALDSLLRVAHSLKKAEDAQGGPMVKMMDDLAKELKDIQSDGRVTTSEVTGLFDNMIRMITLLVGTKPPSKPRKPKSVPEVTEPPKTEEKTTEEMDESGPDKPKAKARKKVEKVTDAKKKVEKAKKLSSIIDRIVTSASVRFFIDPSQKKSTDRYVAMDSDANFYRGRVGVKKGQTYIKLVVVPFRSQMKYDEMLEKGKLKELKRDKFVNQVTSETEMDVDVKKFYQS